MEIPASPMEIPASPMETPASPMEIAASPMDIQGEAEDSSERGSPETSGNPLKRKTPPSNIHRTPTRPCTPKLQYQPEQRKLMALRVTGWPSSWNEAQVNAYIRKSTDPPLRDVGQLLVSVSVFPSCFDSTKTAIVMLECSSKVFDILCETSFRTVQKGSSTDDSEYQPELGMDRHFLGMTPLNSPAAGGISAEYASSTLGASAS